MKYRLYISHKGGTEIYQEKELEYWRVNEDSIQKKLLGIPAKFGIIGEKDKNNPLWKEAWNKEIIPVEFVPKAYRRNGEVCLANHTHKTYVRENEDCLLIALGLSGWSGCEISVETFPPEEYREILN